MKPLRVVSGTNESAKPGILTEVRELIDTNDALALENRDLKDQVRKLTGLLHEIEVTLARRRGTPRVLAGGDGTAANVAPAKPRKRRITRKPRAVASPETVAKRQAALAKAREALAAKRALAKNG